MQGSVLAAFCGNHHHTVGALHAVYCGGHGVLEHGDRFNLNACEVVELAREPVHQDERAVPVETELGLVFFAAACALLDKKSGELAVESFCNVHFGALFKDRCVHGGVCGSLYVERIAE